MAKALVGTISDINRKKYGYPPSWDQIESFLKEVKMGQKQFERFYGIPYNHLNVVKYGHRKLGAPHWHIFYEKLKPAYGAGFIGDYTEEIINGVKRKKKLGKPKKPYMKVVKRSELHHPLLAKLK